MKPSDRACLPLLILFELFVLLLRQHNNKTKNQSKAFHIIKVYNPCFVYANVAVLSEKSKLFVVFLLFYVQLNIQLYYFFLFLLKERIKMLF